MIRHKFQLAVIGLGPVSMLTLLVSWQTAGGSLSTEKSQGGRHAEAPVTTREADVVDGWYYNAATGHYYALTEPMKWQDAQGQAVRMGGNLVTINDAEENAWLIRTFGASERFFIGLTDVEKEGRWFWISGEEADYRSWDVGEPNDDLGNEDGAEICVGKTPGLWNDIPFWLVARGIVECNHKPTAALGSEPSESKTAAVSAARSDTRSLVDANTAFALDLYGKLKQQEGGLFFSPHSISTALAMTYAGARGNTEEQMGEVLHFALHQKRLHPAFAQLERQMNAPREKGGLELIVANALWAQKGSPFRTEFLDVTRNNYGAVLNKVDFETAHEAAREKINAWVAGKTRKRITDLIQRGGLNCLTRLVLTNAVYFKGTWQFPFEKSRTREQPFWTAPGKSVKVPVMTQRIMFGYMENESVQILELPYVGGDFSMMVLLPKRLDGLADLERALSVQNLDGWTNQLRRQEVEVLVPRFELTGQFDLGHALASMGMPDAFCDGVADFSGMDGTKELFISKIIHKAFVAVDEAGTEAAAATAVMIMRGGLMPPAPVFRADHPFLFLIRHNRSGSILFLGRVVNPSK